MKCPVCADVRMREVEKNGVHIDICPDCKGVWLDRGELEKLMQDVREVRQEYEEWQQYPPQQPQRPQPNHQPSHQPYPPHSHEHDYRYSKHKKKKHTVFDIFEDLF